MLSLISKYITIFGLGMFKFAFAPVVASGLGVSFLPTWILSASGMMTTVIILTFMGNKWRPWILKKFFPRRRIFTPQNRRIVKVWRKYGILGVAFLTPIFFSPVIGMMIALSFGEKKSRIIMSMGISALFWGFILSFVVSFYGAKVIHQLIS